MPKLDSYSYIQLNSYTQEIENFIKQIHQEEANQLVINKPLHSKRSKSWRQIQIQIEDKIKTKNYEELLKPITLLLTKVITLMLKLLMICVI